MLCWCFAAVGISALYKIDGIMTKENYVDIMKQHIKMVPTWVFQMHSDLKHTSKVVAQCLKDNKVKRYRSGHHKTLISMTFEDLCAGLTMRVPSRMRTNRNEPVKAMLINTKCM